MLLLTLPLRNGFQITNKWSQLKREFFFFLGYSKEIAFKLYYEIY